MQTQVPGMDGTVQVHVHVFGAAVPTGPIGTTTEAHPLETVILSSMSVTAAWRATNEPLTVTPEFPVMDA